MSITMFNEEFIVNLHEQIAGYEKFKYVKLLVVSFYFRRVIRKTPSWLKEGI